MLIRGFAFIRKILTLLCLGFMMAHAQNAAAAPNTLRFGYYPSPHYFELESSTGHYSGYIFDYMESLSTYLDNRFSYQQCELSRCGEMLEQGMVDVIPAVLSNTDGGYPFEIIDKPITKAAVYLGMRHGRASFYSSTQQKVGYVARSVSENQIAESLRLNGFKAVNNLRYIAYNESSAMFESYQKGEIDGMVIEGMRRSIAIPIVADLFSADVYLVVKKGNETLKQHVYDALARMQASEPWLENMLSLKYFLSGEPLILTDNELNYLNRRKVIHAVTTGSQEPFSYVANGKYQGLLAEIVKVFEHDLGIKFEVEVVETNTEGFNRMDNGQADVVLDMYSDFNWVNLKNMKLTQSYLDIDYVSITRGEDLPDQPKVAALFDFFYTTEFVEKRFPRDRILYYMNVDDCIEAVASGIADVTYVKSIIAQSKIDRSGHRNLRTNGNVVFSHQIAMGVSKREDSTLVKILNKEIAHIDKVNLRRMTSQIEMESLRQKSFIDIVYNYPLQAVTVISVILLSIIALLVYLGIERRRSYRTIRHVYYTNMATGLHNTKWFEDRIPRIIDKLNPKTYTGQTFVMVISIKHKDLLLKNYESGILASAETEWIAKLKAVFPWILECAVGTDLEAVYCLGILKNGSTLETLMQDFERSDRFFTINGINVNIHSVCGVCPIPDAGAVQMNQLLVSAQMARDDAIDRGVRYSVYDAKLEQLKLKHKRIEDIMEDALHNDEFEVWIQPKYHIQTRRIIGGEALVRWRSPELGFMMPGEFIPLFEKNAFVIELDYYMLSKIRMLQQSRSRDGRLCVPLSVNQSGMHFSEDNYIDRMKEMADRIPIPEGLVELEVTESAFFDITTKDPRHNARETMLRLREMGYTFSMDDFSKGYSSVFSLLTLPMDTVKIDMDMLNAAMKSDRARKIFTGIVELCRRAGMKVICEGIETVSHEELLLSCGCNYGQGYLFSKPMPLSVFLNMLDRQQLVIKAEESEQQQ